jgi:hypothetical protein
MKNIKFISGKASFLAILAVTLIASFIFGKTITGIYASTNPDLSCVSCPSVHFEWDTREIDVAAHWGNCPAMYIVDPQHNDKCIRTYFKYADKHLSGGQWKCPVHSWEYTSFSVKDCSWQFTDTTDRPWVKDTYKDVHHSVDVEYDKSSDPNKCHRPSDSDLTNDYGMNNDARGNFKEANSEWMDSIIASGYHLDHGVCVQDSTPSPTATATADPSSTPTPSPTPSSSDTPSPTPEESGSPTPTSTLNPDLCTNIDGVQTSVPDGMHINATGHECVNYELGGAPAPQGGSAAQVLGTSTTTVSSSQVLGANTMGGAGSFDSMLYQAIMGLGGIITSFGIKKALRKAN